MKKITQRVGLHDYYRSFLLFNHHVLNGIRCLERMGNSRFLFTFARGSIWNLLANHWRPFRTTFSDGRGYSLQKNRTADTLNITGSIELHLLS